MALELNALTFAIHTLKNVGAQVSKKKLTDVPLAAFICLKCHVNETQTAFFYNSISSAITFNISARQATAVQKSKLIS